MHLKSNYLNYDLTIHQIFRNDFLQNCLFYFSNNSTLSIPTMTVTAAPFSAAPLSGTQKLKSSPLLVVLPIKRLYNLHSFTTLSLRHTWRFTLGLGHQCIFSLRQFHKKLLSKFLANFLLFISLSVFQFLPADKNMLFLKIMVFDMLHHVRVRHTFPPVGK